MKKTKLFVLTLFLLLCTATVVGAADIKLPDLISDHMLIQQVKPIKLWGSATPGETVTITLESATKVYSTGTTTVKADGTFSAELPGTLAGGPYTLTFDSPSSKKIVKDVLVGELWVQGGQSNMAKTVGASGVYLTEIRPKETKDKIRIFMNTETITTTQPATDLKGSWNVVNSNSANSYSAVGYVALEKLNEELNLPVGGICNAIGGAGMSQFMGPSGSVGSYYYGKVSPLTNLSVRGVMWYQGEGDRGSTENNFASTFNKLIKSWRDDWDDPDMPFVYVMLPPSPMKYYASWTGGYIMEDFSTARLGQLKSYYENDNVAFAVSMDCPPNPGEDPLHPNNKRPIGERLALAALDEIYQVTDQGVSPLYESASVSGNTAVITFSHAYDGLKTTDGKDPRCFMAAGSDGKFYDATAKITGKNTVTITCSKVSKIEQVSYGVEKQMYPYTSADDSVIDTYADVNLTNSEGLPLCPFSYSVTTVKAEKQPLFTVVEDADRTVALNDTYLLPKTITVKKNGQTEQQAAVLWNSDFINTKKEGVTLYKGYFPELDVFLPYTVTVKSLVEAPLFETVTAEKTIEGQLKVTATGREMSQADRNLYLFISFFQADGTFISANSVPCIVKKRETPQIHASVLIPQGAAKVKIMPMNLQLRPWLPVTEITIN